MPPCFVATTGKTGRHRFQNRIRHAFLVLVRRSLARMNEDVRLRVEIHQLALRKEAAEMHLRSNPELLGQFFEVRLQRTFAGDDELGLRKFLLENREGAERRGDAFLRNQPARLQQSPVAVGRRFALQKGNCRSGTPVRQSRSFSGGHRARSAVRLGNASAKAPAGPI